MCMYIKEKFCLVIDQKIFWKNGNFSFGLHFVLFQSSGKTRQTVFNDNKDDCCCRVTGGSASWTRVGRSPATRVCPAILQWTRPSSSVDPVPR